jgi:hypothetical protein
LQDFIADTRANGRQYGVLTVMDDFTRECFGLFFGASPQCSGSAANPIALSSRVAAVLG